MIMLMESSSSDAKHTEPTQREHHPRHHPTTRNVLIVAGLALVAQILIIWIASQFLPSVKCSQVIDGARCLPQPTTERIILMPLLTVLAIPFSVWAAVELFHKARVSHRRLILWALTALAAVAAGWVIWEWVRMIIILLTRLTHG